ncbi:MAG: hypothetical protein ABIZ56_00920, partial [Chthoniobacteraceae bacterium]
MLIALPLLLGAENGLSANVFAPGELVRLTRSETLLFKGENLLGAPEGQEFNVLKQEQAVVYVAFF